MPKKSRMKRLKEWLVTLFLSLGAVFYLPNLKAALKSVTKNRREYLCFYLASLVMSTGFWTVALCTEANMYEAKDRVATAYDYHIEVAMLDNEQYANLDQQLRYQIARDNEYIESFYWVNGDKPFSDGTYTVRIVLDERYGLETAYHEVHYDILNRVSQGHRVIRFSPLYTFEEDYATPYAVQFWTVSLAWLAFSVLMMTVLFLIRLDHFRFIYGIYMTCGADFPKLIGAAGGELLTVTVLMWLPAALVGGGITAVLYVPVGVGLHVSARAVLVPLVGGLVAALASVWLPMRRMSRQAPIRHLAAVDHAGLIASPRRSFRLFGEVFPGKYEMYGFWRMRKYYIRLVLSAVLFAACFVTGLYIADMESYHNELDPGEYIIAYRPDDYYEQEASEGEGDASDEEGAALAWTPDSEEADMIREDLELFIDSLNAVPGVSHAMWDVSITGGYTLSHLLLKPGQLYNASTYTVASEERASDGYTWAANNYAYTAIDAVWIENMIANDLCSFEGNPEAILTEPRQVIISEDVYNQKTYDFKPGDTIVVAVCEEVKPMDLITDAKLLLRKQIELYSFRYETYTVCAVVHGLDSEASITFGVTFEDYAALSNTTPVRSELTVYMEAGTDLDTVRAAEAEIRHLLSPFKDWTVSPTGRYFEAQVKGLKNDRAVILTLAACLLLISPMVWYFSQIMFYRKRRGEFAVLHALGAPRDSFAKLHRLAGGVLSGVAFLVMVLLSLLCNYLIYFLVGTLLPQLHLTESVHYEFTLSVPALMACVLVSVLCGFLSCELPYHLFTKRDVERSGT